METNKDETKEPISKRENVIGNMYAEQEKEFNKKWNWLLLCKTVSEYLFEPFFATMHRNLYEVLTFGTLLKEQVEIIKNKSNG